MLFSLPGLGSLACFDSELTAKKLIFWTFRTSYMGFLTRQRSNIKLCVLTENSQIFMELERPLQCWQQPATGFLSWTRWIHSTQSHLTSYSCSSSYLRSMLILSSRVCLALPKQSYSFRVSYKNFMFQFPLSHARCMSSPSRPHKRKRTAWKSTHRTGFDMVLEQSKIVRCLIWPTMMYADLWIYPRSFKTEGRNSLKYKSWHFTDRPVYCCAKCGKRYVTLLQTRKWNLKIIS
jgi:hypothetical protein